MFLLLQNVPVNVSRNLTQRALVRRRTIEQIAIEALERGLAFTDDTPAADADDALDTPAFENALSAFAQMDGN